MELSKNSLFNLFVKTSIFTSLSIITLSSLVTLYINRGLLIKKGLPEYQREIDLAGSKKDQEWARKIIDGGYILHFRHAERDKWIDVQMYDSLESDAHSNGKNGSRFAENDYFKEAVCLNKRGIIQARAIGEHLKAINFPIGHVVSSPSCRSRQTADIAFGGFQSLHRILVHEGPYSENQKERAKTLRDFYVNLPIKKSTNTIVSSHNSVLHSDILTNNNDKELDLEEGGFYVLSKKGGSLYLEHEFHNFNDFIRVFYLR